MNKHIFSITKKIYEPIIKNNGHYFFKLLEDWDIIVDKNIVNKCIPSKLKFINNKGILILKVYNVIHVVELLHYKSNILFNINKYFNFNCVEDIKFIN